MKSHLGSYVSEFDSSALLRECGGVCRPPLIARRFHLRFSFSVDHSLAASAHCRRFRSSCTPASHCLSSCWSSLCFLFGTPLSAHQLVPSLPIKAERPTHPRKSRQHKRETTIFFFLPSLDTTQQAKFTVSHRGSLQANNRP